MWQYSLHELLLRSEVSGEFDRRMKKLTEDSIKAQIEKAKSPEELFLLTEKELNDDDF